MVELAESGLNQTCLTLPNVNPNPSADWDPDEAMVKTPAGPMCFSADLGVIHAVRLVRDYEAYNQID